MRTELLSCDSLRIAKIELFLPFSESCPGFSVLSPQTTKPLPLFVAEVGFSKQVGTLFTCAQ